MLHPLSLCMIGTADRMRPLRHDGDIHILFERIDLLQRAVHRWFMAADCRSSYTVALSSHLSTHLVGFVEKLRVRQATSPAR